MKFDSKFYEIILNPIYISNLESNLEAALILQLLFNIEIENEIEDFVIISRMEIGKYTGLSDYQVKKGETYLKNNNFIEIEIVNKVRHYKIDYQKYNSVNGISPGLFFIKKLKNNPEAALLLKSFIDNDNKFDNNLRYEIPSTAISLSTGLDRKSQIYARDTLLGFKLLDTENKNDIKLYSINQKNLNKFIKAS